MMGGLKKRTSDKRDFNNVGALISWPKLEDLPTTFTLPTLSLFDQDADGNDDYCASCAGTVLKEPQEDVQLYYPFLFAAAKYEEGGDPDSFGLELRSIGKALVKWGIPEVSDVPESIKKLPYKKRRRFENYPQALRDKAAKHKAKSYFFLDRGPYDFFDTARAAMYSLREKECGILFGVQWIWNIRDFRLDGFGQGFGHALADVGWFDDGIEAQNSYGKRAGREGFHNVSRETFNHFARQYGILMFTDFPKDEAEAARDKERDRLIMQVWYLELIRSFWEALVSIAESIYKKKDNLTDTMTDTPTKDTSVKDTKSNKERLLEEVKKWLGKDASPKNLAPQELSCAEGVSAIINNVFYDFPRDVLDTRILKKELVKSPHFEGTLDPEEADVIVSPRTTKVSGHAGFFTPEGIVSNDSRTGKMEVNYTWDGWITKIGRKRNLHTYLFKVV